MSTIKTLKKKRIETQGEHLNEIQEAMNTIDRAMTNIRMIRPMSLASEIALDSIKHAMTNLHFAKENMRRTLCDDFQKASDEIGRGTRGKHS